MPGALLLVLAVILAFPLPELLLLGRVLIGAQPTLQQLSATLLLRRRVPFALLLAERVEFLLQGVITRPGRLVGVSHSRFLSLVRSHAILLADRICPGILLAGPRFDRQNRTMCAACPRQRRSCLRNSAFAAHRIAVPLSYWRQIRRSPALVGAKDMQAAATRVAGVIMTLRPITDDNRVSVLALRVRPSQERFVGSVQQALQDAADYPHAKPWYRAMYVGDDPVGFVMVSWNVPPQPPDIIGPWFLWKLLVDRRYQGRGYGAQAVRTITELVRAEGAIELLTSYVAEEGGPAGFYQRLGFVPTGELDRDGEVIVSLALPTAGSAGRTPG